MFGKPITVDPIRPARGGRVLIVPLLLLSSLVHSQASVSTPRRTAPETKRALPLGPTSQHGTAVGIDLQLTPSDNGDGFLNIRNNTADALSSVEILTPSLPELQGTKLPIPPGASVEVTIR